MSDPFEEHEITCDRGRISENNETNDISKEIETEIGELFDVYCVAKNKKKLAAFDFSNYGRKKLLKKNIDVSNQVINFCNSRGVEILHNKKSGGMYLKTIAFLPKNYESALKLMKILWYPDMLKFIEKDYQIAIGILLGYNKKNIKYFIKKQFDIELTTEDFKKIEKFIKEMKVNLEELQERYTIVHLKNIKFL